MAFDTQAGKALILSLTFWGVTLAAAAVFLPRYATQLQGSVDDAVTIVGLIFALIGRFTATQPITGVLFASRKREGV